MKKLFTLVILTLFPSAFWVNDAPAVHSQLARQLMQKAYETAAVNRKKAELEDFKVDLDRIAQRMEALRKKRFQQESIILRKEESPVFENFSKGDERYFEQLGSENKNSPMLRFVFKEHEKRHSEETRKADRRYADFMKISESDVFKRFEKSMDMILSMQKEGQQRRSKNRSRPRVLSEKEILNAARYVDVFARHAPVFLSL